MTADDVRQLWAMEMAQLDCMLSRIWHRIKEGDVEAIATAIGICDAQRRISGTYGQGA